MNDEDVYIGEMAKRRVIRVECPTCGAVLDNKWVSQQAGRIRQGRKKHFIGAERVIYACGCGLLFSARDIRKHKCPKKPPKGQQQLATKEQRERYFKVLKSRQ